MSIKVVAHDSGVIPRHFVDQRHAKSVVYIVDIWPQIGPARAAFSVLVFATARWASVNLADCLKPTKL